MIREKERKTESNSLPTRRTDGRTDGGVGGMSRPWKGGGGGGSPRHRLAGRRRREGGGGGIHGGGRWVGWNLGVLLSCGGGWLLCLLLSPPPAAAGEEEGKSSHHQQQSSRREEEEDSLFVSLAIGDLILSESGICAGSSSDPFPTNSTTFSTAAACLPVCCGG